MTGRFTLRRNGRQAILEGSLRADKAAIRLPALGAGITGTLDFAGGGGTALALVGSLAGSGSATLSGIAVPGADPAALPKVFGELEDDTLAVDGETVQRALAAAAKAPLSGGTREFALGLAAGTLSLTPKDSSPSTETGRPVSTALEAALDLRAPSLTVRATQTLHALPKDWNGPPPSVTMVQSGPLSAPRRQFDVDALLDKVAARAIARESARIEAYEFDIRERALFNARLQSDRRREQDRLKAEADAKAAAEAARKAAEAARKAEADRRAKAEEDRKARQRADESAPSTPAPSGAPDTGSAPRPRFDAPPPGALSGPGAAGRY